MITENKNPPLKLLVTKHALELIRQDKPGANQAFKSALKLAAGDYHFPVSMPGCDPVYTIHFENGVLWVHVRPYEEVALIYTCFNGEGGGMSIMTDELFQEILPYCEAIPLTSDIYSPT